MHKNVEVYPRTAQSHFCHTTFQQSMQRKLPNNQILLIKSLPNIERLPKLDPFNS